MHQVVAVGLSLIANAKATKDENYQHVKVIQTNGNDFRLIEVHENYVKKTEFFSPSKNNKIYNDYGHLRTTLGLIRFALSKIQ